MSTPDGFRSLVRDTLEGAAATADTSSTVIDRLLADLRPVTTPDRARTPNRRWIAPLFAAAAVAVVAGGIAVAVQAHSGHGGAPAVAPSTATPTHAQPSSPSTGPSAPTRSASTSSASPSGAIPPCPTSGLRLDAGSGLGAAGTSYTTYYLTNRGSSACSLTGYPGVAVLDASGTVVQRPAARSADLGNAHPVSVKTVRIPPGGRVQFVVSSTDTTPNKDCAALYTGDDLQVYPPDQTTALHLPGTYRICDLVVGPVQPATSAVHTVVGLIRSHVHTNGGWRVVLELATRNSTGQYVSVPGQAPQTYTISDALVPDGGVTLVGPVELTADGQTVTALTILGG